MSTSPPPTSTKRPLEEVSSPSRTGDQPDAKRPALDKVLRNEGEIKESNGLPSIPPVPISSHESNGNGKTNGDKKDSGKDDQDAASTPDGAEAKSGSSTANNSAPAQGSSANAHDETAWIHIRAVISSPEAATIIGKGGENVSKIRQMSNAKCTVSDYQKGAVERILTVSGVVDAVAKVCFQCPMFAPL
jgi:heterogeneous nuclear rnp K-like protein